MEAPVRVDIGGGWLDVPKLARPGAFIVNCAITPLVSQEKWPYFRNSGVGGSAAFALLQGRDPFKSELDAGVGWQDPAIIVETGLCVWRSGPEPSLVFKADGNLLAGRMALYYTGSQHHTPSLTDGKRDYPLIEQAGKSAADGVRYDNLTLLCSGIDLSYEAQLDEGMAKLPEVGELAKKYCGSGFGGYGLYVFKRPAERNQLVADNPDKVLAVEPYLKPIHA